MAQFYTGFEFQVPVMVSEFLDSSDWLVSRHRDQSEMGGPTTLTWDEYNELLSYRQYLRTLYSQTSFDADTFTLRDFTLKDRYCVREYNNLCHIFEKIPEE